jgi:hypothetical protein
VVQLLQQVVSNDVVILGSIQQPALHHNETASHTKMEHLAESAVLLTDQKQAASSIVCDINLFIVCCEGLVMSRTCVSPTPGPLSVPPPPRPRVPQGEPHLHQLSQHFKGRR